MKNSDIAVIVLVASISVGTAYLVADAVIGKPSTGSMTVDKAEPIQAYVPTPDSSIFNKDAINPTVQVVIGENPTP